MAAPIAEIRAIVREVLRDNELEVDLKTRFDDIQDWDPMDLVTLVVEVECRLSLQFELFDIDRLATVGDLAEMIVMKQGLAAA